MPEFPIDYYLAAVNNISILPNPTWRMGMETVQIEGSQSSGDHVNLEPVWTLGIFNTLERF